MARITAVLIIILFTTVTALSIERDHAHRSLFGQHSNKFFERFFSGDSNNDKPSDSFSNFALLKKLLSSLSSSDKSSKLDKLFQLLTPNAEDNENPSSNKLNSLLAFFNNQGSSSSSSNNLQLAMKLLNIAQGKDSLSSLSFSDMKSLSKFLGKQ